MAERLNTLGYSLPADPTRSGEIQLRVDGRPLLDLLEAAIPAASGQKEWPEKGEARVVPRALKASLHRGREYAVFTCSHCDMPEDLSLQPFTITHSGDLILWTLAPPGAGFTYETDVRLEFRFARSAYAETIRHLLARDPSPAPKPTASIPGGQERI